MTTEAQARAIAEALGWAWQRLEGEKEFYWSHELHHPWGNKREQAPRLADDTTLGHAMCYDAIVWLHDRCWTVECYDDGWRLIDPEGDSNSSLFSPPAAIEAAMIQELGL